MNYKEIALYDGNLTIDSINYSADGDVPDKPPYELSINITLFEHFNKKNIEFFKHLQQNFPTIDDKEKYLNFKLLFEDVIYFEVINESYEDLEKYESDFSGTVFRFYKTSGYLELLKKRKIAAYMEFEYPYLHFSVYGNNHLIEVVCLTEPNIKILNET